MCLKSPKPSESECSQCQDGAGNSRITYGVFPVSEAIGIMVRISADHRDKGVHHQSDHKKDLENGHIKLSDSEIANRKPVENPGVTSQHLRRSKSELGREREVKAYA